jgi:hypothetical protein
MTNIETLLVQLLGEVAAVRVSLERIADALEALAEPAVLEKPRPVRVEP